MKTNIQPVHLAITFRTEWTEKDLYEAQGNLPAHANLMKASHEAAHDEHYLWGYWGEYFHSKLTTINPTIMKDRKMHKKQWKGLYHARRHDDWRYRQHMEQYEDGMGCPGDGRLDQLDISEECDSMGIH